MNFEKMDAQLKLWSAKIDEFAAKLDRAGSKTSNHDRQRIIDIKAKQAVAQAKLDEFKAAGNEKWADFKTGIWIAWDDLEAAFQDFEQSEKEAKTDLLLESEKDN